MRQLLRDTFILCLLGTAIYGCAEGTGTLDEVDPEAAPQDPSYTEHVAPIVDYYCLSCHSEAAQPGAVDGYAYDSCEQVKTGWYEFYNTTVVQKSMPPGGALRVTSSEALILTRWYEHGAQCE